MTATPQGLHISGARETWATARVALRGSRRRLLLAVAFLLSGSVLELISPAALGAIVDVVLGRGGVAEVFGLGALMFGAGVLGAVLMAVGSVMAAQVCEIVLAKLREDMVAAALGLPQDTVERTGTGDLVSRASDDVSRVAEAVPRVVPALSSALFTIVLTLAGLAVIDPRYALVVLAAVPVHVLTVRWYLRRAPRIYAAERAATAERARHVLSALRGLDTVRAFGLQDRHRERIAASSWDAVRWAVRARTVQNGFFGRLNGAEFLGMAGILIVGFLLVRSGAGTVGGATAAMLFFLRLFGPINQLLFVVDDLQSALASLARIVGVIRSADAIPETPPTQPPTDPATVLEVRGVGFAYPGSPEVLHDVSLRVSSGQRVALVGGSGAGKSTLAAMLAGVHEPDRGSLSRTVPALLLTQETHLFTGTLRENLTLAAPAASDAGLLAALEAVGAGDLAARLPAGLDSEVGSGGQRLSTVDLALVALARLLLADPGLAVLDEATAEASSAGAMVLERATDAVLAGRAAVVVAHRLNQAAVADWILVMEAGRIVEAGTHEGLVASKGRYARLWSDWEAPRREAGDRS